MKSWPWVGFYFNKESFQRLSLGDDERPADFKEVPCLISSWKVSESFRTPEV